MITINLTMKRCSKCKIKKPLSEFYKDKTQPAGYEYRCRVCSRNKVDNYQKSPRGKEIMRRYNRSDKHKQYSKEYSKTEAFKRNQKKYAQSEKGKAANKRKRDKYYYSEHGQKRIKEKRYSEKTRKYNRDKMRQRRKNIVFRLKANIRRSVYSSLKTRYCVKNNSTWKALPYTPQELKDHLEKLFQPGMSWDNYGEWHIDHIIPQSYFTFTSMYDPKFLQCWALENLQPLWAKDNLRKGAKLPSNLQP